MNINNILNPVPDPPQSVEHVATKDNSQSAAPTTNDSESQAATSTKDDDTVLRPSTNIPDDKTPITPTKRHRVSSTTSIPSSSKSIDRIDDAVSFSPSEGFHDDQPASKPPTHSPNRHSPARDAHIVSNSQTPNYQPEHSSKPNNYSVFNALLNYPELTLEVAKNLDIEDLVSLYAISKDFHMLVNSRFTAMIKAQWRSKAYESGTIFAHKCYRSLCMRDPARRVNEVRPEELRFIPSFRWLRMVLFREAVVEDIMFSMLKEGHRMPKLMTLILKKIWFTMDIADNRRRVGLMHNYKFWSSKDLLFATMFFLKLDMRLTNPGNGNGEVGLKKMLLGQRSLSMLARVLRRDEMRTSLDMLRMLVRFSYEPPNPKGLSILGVPAEEVGRLQYEGWGLKNTRFIGIDDLVLREAVERKLNLHTQYVEMMIYGFIDKDTYEDFRTPMPPQVEEMSEEDEGDEEVEEELELARQRLEFLEQESEYERRGSGDEAEWEDEGEWQVQRDDDQDTRRSAAGT